VRWRGEAVRASTRRFALGAGVVALAALAGAADTQVVPLFVLDPALRCPAGAARRAYLEASLTDLGMRVGGLQLRRGDPVREVAKVARAAHASTVHVAEDFGPHGRERDLDVEAELARHGISLVRTGSPYAVEPGRVVNKTGDHYQVFTPYSRAWRDHGWRTALEPPRAVHWVRPLKNHPLDDAPIPAGLRLPAAGESAAHRRWRDFLERHLGDYALTRDRPDLEGTSRMSTHLKWGEIHPRTMLADLARHPGAGAATYTTELAWREFYADVLWRSPGSGREFGVPRSRSGRRGTRSGRSLARSRGCRPTASTAGGARSGCCSPRSPTTCVRGPGRGWRSRGHR